MKFLFAIFSLVVAEGSLCAQGKNSFVLETEKIESQKDVWVSKLRSIKIPTINFKDTLILEAVNFIEKQCAELDEGGKGLPIFGKNRLNGIATKIDWKTESENCATALISILRLVDLRLKTEDRGISIIPGETVEERIQKLKKLIIPSVEFNETPVTEAITYLMQRSFDLDLSPDIVGAKPKIEGIGIIFESSSYPRVSRELKIEGLPPVFENPSPTGNGIGDTLITFSEAKISIWDALIKTCDIINCEPVPGKESISIIPKSSPATRPKIIKK